MTPVETEALRMEIAREMVRFGSSREGPQEAWEDIRKDAQDELLAYADAILANPTIAAALEGREIKQKRAPVRGWAEGIPWDMHLRAYEAYSKKWSPQPALIDLEGRNCRGGFGTAELDDFIPGWRDELSERRLIEARTNTAERELAEAREEIERLNGLIDRRNAKLSVPWPLELREALIEFENKWDVELCAIEDIEKYNDWALKEAKRARTAESALAEKTEALEAAELQAKSLTTSLKSIMQYSRAAYKPRAELDAIYDLAARALDAYATRIAQGEEG